jgi:hypothetical protein
MNNEQLHQERIISQKIMIEPGETIQFEYIKDFLGLEHVSVLVDGEKYEVTARNGTIKSVIDDSGTFLLSTSSPGYSVARRFYETLKETLEVDQHHSICIPGVTLEVRVEDTEKFDELLEYRQ